VNPAQWVPAQAGEGNAWTLSPDLGSMATVKEYVSIVSGTHNPKNGHPGMYAAFSGYVPAGSGTLNAVGPTLDQVAAREAHLDAGTGLRTLEVGVSRHPNSDVAYKALSYAGPGRQNFPDTDPQSIFRKLFRPGAAAATAAPAPDPAAPSSWVLDAVKGDLARLQRRISVADRARLDEHLQAIHDLEKRLRAPAPMGGACAAPPAPGPAALPNDGTAAHNEAITGLAEVVGRLVALALACDRTRVVTVAYTLPVGWDRFAGYTGTEHGVSHSSSWPQKGHPHVAMKMKAIAAFLEKLKALPEGTTNVLHNTAVFATTDCTNPQTHSGRDLPIIVAGRAGGRLRGNVHVRLDGASSFGAGAAVVEAIGLGEKPFKASPISALLA
jgi:hypothetical protein